MTTALLCEPFRITQGWGSVGTIIVGVLAIAASAIFNLVTLKRSAQTLKLAEETYARTEERYRADTLEARNEKLRSAVMDASHKVGQVWTAGTLDHLALLIERAHLLRGRNVNLKWPRRDGLKWHRRGLLGGRLGRGRVGRRRCRFR